MKRTLTRLFWSAVTLLGTAVLTFIMLNAIPAYVAHVISGTIASAEVIRLILIRYHLDYPVWKLLCYHL